VAVVAALDGDTKKQVRQLFTLRGKRIYKSPPQGDHTHGGELMLLASPMMPLPLSIASPEISATREKKKVVTLNPLSPRR